MSPWGRKVAMRGGCLALCLTLMPGLAHADEFDIRDFGAVGDGKTLATDSIRRAVEAAAKHAAATGKGQRVVVPPGGEYLTGTFSLATRVVLQLDGTLLASTNVSDYPGPEGWNWDPALISTANATDTGIVGSGILDGGSTRPEWSTGFDPKNDEFEPRTWGGVYGCVGECRPKMVRFVDCARVGLSGEGGALRLRNSPDWTMLFRRCTDVRLHLLDVYGDSRWPNNDGVDFESCSGMEVLDSVFNTGDDGIVFSSGNTNALRVPFTPQPPPPCENAVVRNVSLRSHSSAIKFEAIFQTNHSGMRNMLFESITIWGSSRGIGFQQRTGAGDIENITFRDVDITTLYPTGSNWWGSGEPVWITNIAERAEEGLLGGTVRDVNFQNVKMVGENGVLLSGRTRAMGPINFDNVSIEIAVRGNTSCAKGHSSPPPTGCRDYRPIDDSSPSRPELVYGNTTGIMFEGNGSATLHLVRVTFTPPAAAPRPGYWARTGCTDVGGGWSVGKRGHVECNNPGA
eukprot:Hpha_TRINITY_DN27933_c0_g1::TRINITY_DN27933_c0_g1_i1::g.44972::m.44972